MEVLEEILKKAEEHKAVMRVIGSIAFRIRCPDYKYMQYANQRFLTDVDFVCYKKQVLRVADTFDALGWEENMGVLQKFGDKRRIFYHPSLPIHSDIFIDKLRFCHEIDFKGRLALDSPTISLVDLLLEKLQIVEINRKDLVDVMVLLSQYPVGVGDSREHVDGAYLAGICSKDWGWWRTATMNIEKVHDFAGEYLGEEDAAKVRQRLDELRKMIDEQKKSMGWKMRAKVGDKRIWYREVEEVER